MADQKAGASAVFRAFSMPGRKPRGEWSVAGIEIGTRSTCALQLNDPVVAEQHCTLRFTGSAFVVEDRGSVTGTWHNGVAVSSAVELANGDQVVIGVTRLAFELKQEDDGRAALEVLIEESSFHYKKPKPGEFHTDADEWVRSEVRFGKVAAVRGMVWLAGLLAIVGVTWIFATRGGERMLQPGALDGSHGLLFAAELPNVDSGGSPNKDRLTLSLEKVAHESCKVCHASKTPGDVKSCAACHAEMSTRHPFYNGSPEHDSKLSSAVAQPSTGCRMCHDVQHNGLSKQASTDAARMRLDEGKSSTTWGLGVCMDCHTAGFGTGTDDALRAEVKARIGVLSSLLVDASVQAPSDRHEYGFDEFAHKTHLNRSIDCGVCHVQSPAPAGSAGGADFKSVGFGVCAACHVQGMDSPSSLPGIDAGALKALRNQLASKPVDGKQLMQTMSWHGRGEQCLQCHAEGDQHQPKPELKTAEREIAQRSFGIRRIAHGQHVQASADKALCAQCHGDPKTLEGGLVVPAANFLHGSHVETLWPTSKSAQASLSQASCLSCHAAQWDSTTLAGAQKLDLGEACKTCHDDPSRAANQAAVSEHVVERKTETRTDFPHKTHAKIEGGCFACHAFKGADDGDPRAVPQLLDGVVNCTKCHSDHQRIAGGACTFCHPQGAAAGSGSAILFQGKRPFRNDWPAALNFNHFGGRPEAGHISFMAQDGSPAIAGCAKCHDIENMKNSNVVGDLSIPGARGSLCVDCHAFNRGWFHWSLPEAKR